MPTDHHLDPDEDALVQLGYETEDVKYDSLAKSVGWFFAFVLFCGLAGVAIFGFLIGFDHLRNPPENTAPFVSRLPAEPNPLLQTATTAKTDIRDLRRTESELLHGSPTWVNKEKGIVRMPIERAVDLYLQKIGADPNQKTTITSGTPPISSAPPVNTPDIATPLK